MRLRLVHVVKTKFSLFIFGWLNSLPSRPVFSPFLQKVPTFCCFQHFSSLVLWRIEPTLCVPFEFWYPYLSNSLRCLYPVPLDIAGNFLCQETKIFVVCIRTNICLYKVLRPFYNKLMFYQRQKKTPFSKMIPFSAFSLSQMDDLYRNINWATASNIEDDCPDSKLG